MAAMNSHFVILVKRSKYSHLLAMLLTAKSSEIFVNSETTSSEHNMHDSGMILLEKISHNSKLFLT